MIVLSLFSMFHSHQDRILWKLPNTAHSNCRLQRWKNNVWLGLSLPECINGLVGISKLNFFSNDGKHCLVRSCRWLLFVISHYSYIQLPSICCLHHLLGHWYPSLFVIESRFTGLELLLMVGSPFCGLLVFVCLCILSFLLNKSYVF